MAALSPYIQKHTDTSLLCEAIYSLKMPNQQRWRWVISLSLFGVISVHCFAGDGTVSTENTHALYIWHIMAVFGATRCVVIRRFGAGPAFVLALSTHSLSFCQPLSWPLTHLTHSLWVWDYQDLLSLIFSPCLCVLAVFTTPPPIFWLTFFCFFVFWALYVCLIDGVQCVFFLYCNFERLWFFFIFFFLLYFDVASIHVWA